MGGKSSVLYKGRKNGEAIALKRFLIFAACDEKAVSQARTVRDTDLLGCDYDSISSSRSYGVTYSSGRHSPMKMSSRFMVSILSIASISPSSTHGLKITTSDDI